MEVYESFSPGDTMELGRKMGSSALPGSVYALIGGLGTGKTAFTAGFAEGMGIKEHVNSPTYTIVQVYDSGEIPLYHFDVYRIEDIDEMEETGFSDYIYGDGVSVIEWADIIGELIPDDAVTVTFERDPLGDPCRRRITVDRGDKEVIE
ncbi:MAG: tRNA (adenosine(37)-N6)-threonylcarbamoyltransferase complex ATPase subunit type 1 TsaE [Lachnospiraceae bacterium]|nr:tRNA (adenosine(37)-N6)-threonylcarbamoyltransferase complex ATPase subunit type 1 TsaE [Lachnospiraceae bacterium]